MRTFIPVALLILSACSNANSDASANPSATRQNEPAVGAADKNKEADAAYAAALPALGDMTIFAIGRGEDTLSARPMAEDAITALGQARTLLLSGKSNTRPSSGGDPFVPFRDAPAESIESAKKLWAISRSTSCSSIQITNCEQRYDDLLFVLADSAGLEWDEQPDNRQESTKMASKYNFPNCASLRSAGKSPTALLDDFEKVFPTEIIGEESVDKLDLSSADLRSIGSYLSCMTGLTPNMPPEIADSAASLYASKKHSRAAFAALDALAEDSGQDAKFAREFAEQMREYIKKPAE